MSRSKRDMFDAILISNIVLEKELREAGLRESTIKKPFEGSENWLKDDVKAVYDWLIKHVVPVYEEILKIRKMVKPEVWEHYKAMDITGLAEQEILAEAQKKLRRVWRQYPKWKERKEPKDGK